MSYSFREFTPKDFSEYLSLYKDVFGFEVTKDFINWKISDYKNPQNSPLIYLAIAKDNSIAGSISFFPVYITYKNKKDFIVQAGDVMVSPSHRKQGLFKKMIAYGEEKLKEKGCSLIYGFPNHAAHSGWKSMGFIDVYQTTNYIKILSFSKLLAKKHKALSIIAFPFDALNRIFNYFLGIKEQKKYEIELYKKCAELPCEDYILACNSNKAHQIKDKAYLEWRYDKKNADSDKYELLVIKKQTEIIGVFVIAFRKNGYALEIADYFLDNSDNLNICTKIILDYYKNSGAGYIAFRNLIGDKNLINTCKKNLFKNINRNFYTVMKALDKNHSVFHSKDIWHITAGDMDTL